MAILPNLSQMSREQLEAAYMAQMEAAQSKLTLKVGQSGTVCLYHGARYPIALYAEQWERLLPFLRSGKVEAFIAANASLLSRKPA